MHGNLPYLESAAHSATPPGHSARSRCSQRHLRFDVIRRAMFCCAPHLMTLLNARFWKLRHFLLFAAVYEPEVTLSGSAAKLDLSPEFDHFEFMGSPLAILRASQMGWF